MMERQSLMYSSKMNSVEQPSSSTTQQQQQQQQQSPKKNSILAALDKQAREKRITAENLSQILAKETEKLSILQRRKEELGNVTKCQIQDHSRRLYEDIKYMTSRCATLKGHMTKISREKLPSRLERPDIYTCVENIAQLEKALAYLHVVKFVKETSGKIEANLETGLNSEAIDLFQLLLKVHQSYISSTECLNFKNYFVNTVLHWERCLENKFTKDFEKQLESFGWPSNILTSTPTLEAHEKFHRAVRNLIRISPSVSSSSTMIIGSNSRSHEENVNVKSALVADFKEPLLPIKVMIEPLKKRFRYHFFTNKVTSDPTRPEWYFTQIKSWARELIPFIRTHLEPLTVSEVHLSSVADFVRYLSEMLILKADSQLTSGTGEQQIEDVTFARILEESIVFENEMGNFLGEDLVNKKIYIPPFVSTLFSQPHVLQRWLAIERKACLEKLDEIFSSPSAWDRAVVPGPAEVVDLFMAVLRFVTDRFAHLQEPSQKVLFLQLLVDMIDDFRVRCLQTWKSRREIEADYSDGVLIDYIIADTLRTIQTTVESWEDLPFFASLSFYLGDESKADENDGEIQRTDFHDDNINSLSPTSRDDPSAFALDSDLLFRSPENSASKETNEGAVIGAPSQGIFSHVLKLYECLSEDILRKWCSNVISKLRADITKGYSRRKWHMFPPDGFEENGETLSQELLALIQRLKALSKGIASGMNPEVAQIWLKRLAVQFDEMVMDTLVYPNRFTPGAFLQLRYDMVYGIFPVFAECNISTSMFLVGINSALRIWEMPLARLVLLYETLTDSSTSFAFQEDTLAELELSLRPTDVIKLLRTRTDIQL